MRQVRTEVLRQPSYWVSIARQQRYRHQTVKFGLQRSVLQFEVEGLRKRN
jgi:hypothetical protein